MCHRMLYGTPGTTANVAVTNHTNPVINGQNHVRE